MIDNIIKLSQIAGVSGREEKVAAEILAQLEGVCHTHVDPLGNIIAYKEGKTKANKKIMLSAHMDEVGFIITYIDGSGLLKFSTCGGIDAKVVVGRRVLVGDNNLVGLIGMKATHQKSQEEKDNAPSLDSLYIDIGAKDKAEAETLVKLGDRAVFDCEKVELGGGMFAHKALDDRAGCGLMIELLKNYDEIDYYCAFTVQEETGLTGAVVAGNTVQPDVNIAIETTTAGDVGGVPVDKQVCRVGRGPVVSFMDKGTIYDSELYHSITNLAKEKSIPVQTKEGVYGGNESRAMQVAGKGVRVAAVSMPCRYLHSAYCVLKDSDITDTYKLLEAAIPMINSL